MILNKSTCVHNKGVEWKRTQWMDHLGHGDKVSLARKGMWPNKQD